MLKLYCSYPLTVLQQQQTLLVLPLPFRSSLPNFSMRADKDYMFAISLADFKKMEFECIVTRREQLGLIFTMIVTIEFLSGATIGEQHVDRVEKRLRNGHFGA
jgi:hypothetical protein